MSYSVVFCSKTGNTELLANRIRKVLGEEGCVYFGAPESAPDEARSADVIFAGSWTDKGTATPELTAFLEKLDRARVFLFGTCGFGESDEYFNQVLARTRDALPSSNELVGSFMCQGRMPEGILERYRGMLAAAEPDSPEAKRAALFISNFEKARSHPDANDLRSLDARVKELGL